MATSPATVELPEIGWGKLDASQAETIIAEQQELNSEIKSRSLLECLTEQILCDGITVEEARQIVINWSYYKKFRQPLKNGLPRNYESLREVERQMIRAAVNASNGNMKKAAESLGLGVTTLYRRLREMVSE